MKDVFSRIIEFAKLGYSKVMTFIKKTSDRLDAVEARLDRLEGSADQGDEQ